MTLRRSAGMPLTAFVAVDSGYPAPALDAISWNEAVPERASDLVQGAR
jgi:hypothetical protein